MARPLTAKTAPPIPPAEEIRDFLKDGSACGYTFDAKRFPDVFSEPALGLALHYHTLSDEVGEFVDLMLSSIVLSRFERDDHVGSVSATKCLHSKNAWLNLRSALHLISVNPKVPTEDRVAALEYREALV